MRSEKVSWLNNGDYSPIWAQSPAFPGKYVVKASLFDTVAAPTTEAFTESKISWIDVKIGQSE